MARRAITDYLSSYAFWLFDVGPNGLLSLPVLTPLFGFSAITGPELQLETQDITEGNWHLKRKVIKKADVPNITLSRGVTFFDTDFWRWTLAALTGDPNAFKFENLLSFLPVGGPTPRRTLLLIHFFPRNPFGIPAVAAAAITTGLAATVGAATPGGLGLGLAASTAIGALAPGPFEFAARVPARAFMLNGCLPVRYKATSDFDARSGDISITELELAVESFEQISLGA